MQLDELNQRYEEVLEQLRQELPRKHGNTLLGTVTSAVADEFAGQVDRRRPIVLIPTTEGLVDVILCGDPSSPHSAIAGSLHTWALDDLPPHLKKQYWRSILAGPCATLNVRARTAGSLLKGRTVEAGTWIQKELDLVICNPKTTGKRTAIEVSCLQETPSELLYSAMLWSQQAPLDCTQPIAQESYNTIAMDVDRTAESRHSEDILVAIAFLALPAAQEGVVSNHQGTLTLMNASAHFASTWKSAIEESGLQIMIVHNATSISLPVNFIYRALPRCNQMLDLSLDDFADVVDACSYREKVDAEKEARCRSEMV